MSFNSAITARLGLDTSDFRRGLETAQRDLETSVGQFDKVAGALGKFGVGFSAAAAVDTLTEAMANAVEYADKIVDLGERYTVNTTTLQRWGTVAETNGSSLDSLAQGFGKLIVSQSRALGGNEATIASFESLGVSIEDLRSLSPEELMKQIGGGSLRAADLVDVLGRNSLELVPTLRSVADGTAHLGAALDKELVVKLADAASKIKELKQQLTVLAGEGAGALIDHLNGIKTAPLKEALVILTRIAGINAAAMPDLPERLGMRKRNNPDADAPDGKKAHADDIEEGKTNADQDKSALKAADDLAQKKMQLAKALDERALAALALAERKAELEKRAGELAVKEAQSGWYSEEQRVDFALKRLAIEKDLDSVKDKIAVDEKKTADDKLDFDAKAAAARQRAIGALDKAQADAAAKQKAADDARGDTLSKLAVKQSEIAAKLATDLHNHHENQIDEALKSPADRAADRRTASTRARVGRAVDARERDTMDRASRGAHHQTGHTAQSIRQQATTRTQAGADFKAAMADAETSLKSIDTKLDNLGTAL